VARPIQKNNAARIAAAPAVLADNLKETELLGIRWLARAQNRKSANKNDAGLSGNTGNDCGERNANRETGFLDKKWEGNKRNGKV
jgi:hypothetical protein